MTRERKICYDYYNVNVPYDVGDEEQRLDIAIITAREQASCIACPATGWPGLWTMRRSGCGDAETSPLLRRITMSCKGCVVGICPI